MVQSREGIQCVRCSRWETDVDQQANWASVYRNGVRIANLCPVCQTPDERAEAESIRAGMRLTRMTEVRRFSADAFRGLCRLATVNGWIGPRGSELDRYLARTEARDHMLILACIHDEDPTVLAMAFPSRWEPTAFAEMTEGEFWPVLSPAGFTAPSALLEVPLSVWMDADQALVRDDGAISRAVRARIERVQAAC